jgi:hypothetical protein
MQIGFSPLTVYNTVTVYISADGGENNLKQRTEKKIGARGQFATRDSFSFPLTVWKLQIQYGELKNIHDIDSKNMKLGFIDSGQLVHKNLSTEEK